MNEAQDTIKSERGAESSAYREHRYLSLKNFPHLPAIFCNTHFGYPTTSINSGCRYPLLMSDLLSAKSQHRCFNVLASRLQYPGIGGCNAGDGKLRQFERKPRLHDGTL